MTTTAQLAVRPAAAFAPVAVTRVSRRNRIATVAITGALLIVGTTGVLSATLHANPAPQPASIVSVQLPTE